MRSPRTLTCVLAVLALSACGSTVHGAADGAASGLTGDVAPSSQSPSEVTTDPGGTSVTSTSGTGATPPSTVGSTGAGSTATGGATATGTSGGGSLTGTGAASTSQPIKVGVVLTNTASTADYGFSSGETFSEQQVDQGVFDGLNKQGGIAGHKVVPVYAKTDPNSSSWATDFAAACATFTQDNHVAAVLGYQFTYDGGFESCLTKKQIPHLTTGFNIPDAHELTKHPLHRSLAVPTIDHRSLAKLQGAIEDGVLTPKSKLGVLLDECPGTIDSWNKVAKPFLTAHGITPAFVTEGSCNTGNNAGAANQVSGIPSGVLKARQAGVDVLTFLTVSEGPALAVLAPAAEAQNWHPTYLVSSLANLSALEGVTPQSQLRNVKGYGWMPAQDVGVHLQPARTSSQKRCLALLLISKIRPSDFGDYTNAYRICDAVLAYEAVLKRSSDNVAGGSVIGALDGLGTSFDSPDVLDGATLFRVGRENVAPAHMRAVTYNESCSCFTYHGATRALP